MGCTPEDKGDGEAKLCPLASLKQGQPRLINEEEET